MLKRRISDNADSQFRRKRVNIEPAPPKGKPDGDASSRPLKRKTDGDTSPHREAKRRNMDNPSRTMAPNTNTQPQINHTVEREPDVLNRKADGDTNLLKRKRDGDTSPYHDAKQRRMHEPDLLWTRFSQFMRHPLLFINRRRYLYSRVA